MGLQPDHVNAAVVISALRNVEFQGFSAEAKAFVRKFQTKISGHITVFLHHTRT